MGVRERLERLAQEFITRSPALVDEVRTFARHPRLLGSWLEERSPWLGRQFLGVASNLAEPFTLGMGLQVERIGEDIVEILMSGGWRNQGEGGVVHTAALSVLGEVVVRLFWEHHLDLRNCEAEPREVHVRVLARPFGQMKGVFRLPETDRESILHRLRSDGAINAETQTLIYDRDGRLVAEVTIEWRINRQLRLGHPTAGSEI